MVKEARAGDLTLVLGAITRTGSADSFVALPNVAGSNGTQVLQEMARTVGGVSWIKPDGTREVWCAVFMLQFVPKATDGMTFGYKDMDEGAGPVIARCPERILDLLTETDSKWALAWRQRCRSTRSRVRAADGALRFPM